LVDNAVCQNFMTREQKLERFAEREFKRNLDNMIVKENDGSYIVFGKYRVAQHLYGYMVSTWSDDIHCFDSKRNAVSWCVADKFNQLTLANTILNLDRRKQTLTADIHCRQSIGRRSQSTHSYEIINMKVQPKQILLNSVSSELEKCVNSAKYMQIRGFSNETARTSGPSAK
jgi:hypothetical protein